jgi:hypothetical protein
MLHTNRSSLMTLAFLSLALIVGCGRADAGDEPMSALPKPLVDAASGAPGHRSALFTTSEDQKRAADAYTKVVHLQRQFADLYTAQPMLVQAKGKS